MSNQPADPTNNIAAFLITDPWNLRSAPAEDGVPASIAAAKRRWPDATEAHFRAAVGIAAPLIRAAGENTISEATALDLVKRVVDGDGD